MTTGQEDSGQRVYRKLLYFYENKIPIHFSLEKGGWRNGLIIDLSATALTCVVEEFVAGQILFLCEDLVLDSIEAFIPKNEARPKIGVAK